MGWDRTGREETKKDWDIRSKGWSVGSRSIPGGSGRKGCFQPRSDQTYRSCVRTKRENRGVLAICCAGRKKKATQKTRQLDSLSVALCVPFTVSWNCRNLRMLSYTPRPHMIALTMEENLSSRMTMSDAFCATCVSHVLRRQRGGAAGRFNALSLLGEQRRGGQSRLPHGLSLGATAEGTGPSVSEARGTRSSNESVLPSHRRQMCRSAQTNRRR